MTTAKILIPMSDYGHDPTETAVPYTAFTEAGFEVSFATENGKSPECDTKMLTGITQKLLLIDSSTIHKLLASYFLATVKLSKKSVAAVCHGVMVLSETKHEGKSVIHECVTTALPARFEQSAFWVTRIFLGDYYKNYGAGSDDVETSVRKCLDNPKMQYKNSLGMNPFVVEDEKYNYISARFPPDAQLLAEKTIALVRNSLA
ncbi:hypothetical protein VTL71DRAFT_11323 [Oculimacula yallundae]|uniref:Uncharacterized protein n=1 Tax=Oculimacula yallundae TaxID=86028 RepID=A0ABR4CQ66_9HELO